MIVPSISAAAMFCEDIRTEMGGTNTLVGLLPDNLQVAQLPATVPKLAIYVRTTLALDASFNSNPIEMTLRDPNGKEVVRHGLSTEFIEKHAAEAREQGAPMLSLLSRVISAPFKFGLEGRYSVVVAREDCELLAGILNVRTG